MTRIARKEKYRHEILEAAEKVFAQSGFFDARMEDIAREADYAPASLYGYFKSKDEIFNTILEARFEELLENMEFAESSVDDFPENLKTIVAVLNDFGKRYDDFIKILFSLQMHGGLKDKRCFTESIEKFYYYIKLLEMAIEKGIKQGKVKKYGANQLAFLLHGMFISAAMRYFLMDEETEEIIKEKEGVAELVLEIFLQGILK